MNSGAPLEIQFRLRSRRQPPGTAPRPSAAKLPRITQVLALAIHLQELIRTGEARDYAELGRLTCLCRERVSQIMRLNYLAPDIQIELLYLPPSGGRFPISETAMRLIASSLSWEKQRERWSQLKTALEL